MRRGLIAFLAGGIWELLRFVTVFLLSTVAPAPAERSHLLLLWMGAPALLLAALFFSCAYYPERVSSYLPMVRLGAVLTAVADIVMVVGGAPLWAEMVSETTLPPRPIIFGVFLVLFVDLVVAVILFTLRPEDDQPGPAAEPRPDQDLPDYSSTEVQDTPDDSSRT